jgi:hypothetical protein
MNSLIFGLKKTAIFTSKCVGENNLSKLISREGLLDNIIASIIRLNYHNR